MKEDKADGWATPLVHLRLCAVCGDFNYPRILGKVWGMNIALFLVSGLLGCTLNFRVCVRVCVCFNCVLEDILGT